MNNDIEDNNYTIEANLDEDELYDELLGIAKINGIIEANHASNSAHLLHILRNSGVEIHFKEEADFWNQPFTLYKY